MRPYHKSVCPISLPWLPTLVATAVWLVAAAARADDAPATTPPPKAGYDAGLTNILKIAGDLHVALAPKQQQLVQGAPVYLEQVRTPCIAPIEVSSGAEAHRTVQISAGFIQLVNSIAHARALTAPGNDAVKAYAARLAASGDQLPSAAEGVAPDKAWDFDTMNVQAGQFNQLAGALVAIDLAHHYLGHYKKYAAQLSANGAANGPGPAINNLVTEKEWREAVLKGAKNALDCGLGVDGLKTLLECMDAMPNRPSWSAYFVPPKANLTKVSRDLQRLENDFFLVEK